MLRLGRVSNLPTVWTNGLAATVLAGGDPLSLATGSVLTAITLFYLGGMYLNDAFDREIDARERPTRPIPSGQASAGAVFGLGFAMLAGGITLLALHGAVAGVAGLALAGAILAYDLYHKGNRFSPVVMGLCRFLVYVCAASAAVGSVPGPVLLAGFALMAHVIGLTYAAKQESLDRIDRLWPLAVLAVPIVLGLRHLTDGVAPVLAVAALALVDAAAVAGLRARKRPGAVPHAVGSLIAAISLLDAMIIAPVSPLLALVCAGGYVLTRLAHRVVPGT